MTANYLIGLREGLEATLIVVLLMAYLVKSGRRHLLPRMWTGVGFAVAVSCAFGALLTYGPRGLTFEAQEAIGGSLSVLAVGLVTWMVFWMARTARTLGSDLRSRVDVQSGGTAWGLAVVAAVAVGRGTVLRLLDLPAAGGPAGTGNGGRPGLPAPPGSPEGQSREVLYLERGGPDRDRRRCPGLRGPRFPGSRHPPRPAHPGLRRLSRRPAVVLVRHAAEGNTELLPCHHLV
jgi:hypothetical protein